MSTETEVSDELLNAFADGELDAVEKARLLNLMAKDDVLRSRVCRIWQLKEMLRGAYPAVPAASASVRRSSRLQRYRHALAATLILTVGIVAGWTAREEAGRVELAGFQLDARRMDEGKVIVHLSSAAPDRLKAALEDIDRLSRAHDRAGRPFQVELLTNSGGLSLLRADVSPYAARIAALRREHGNVSFVACNNAIELLRLAGVQVTLLPEVSVATSAADEIMMRLQQGWAYIRV